MPRPGAREDVRLRIQRGVDVTDDGCWIWQGPKFGNGYGRIEMREGQGRAARKHRLVHRVSYQAFLGPIPEGMQIDHLCRVRGCCNPQHLEAVTPRENTMRGLTVSAANAAKTHCVHGHAFVPENTRIKANGQRACRACLRAADARRVRPRKSAPAQPGSKGEAA